MTTTIKITELTNIGANLNGNTLVPVVNMNGTPVTQRSNVDNLANYVLNTGTGANLGAVGNITITGGNAGEVLTTDGNGVLSWEASGLTYSNANVAAYLPTYTGNITGDYVELTHDLNANVVYGNYIYGDASNVTNLPVGTVAFLNTDGNASNVLQGDGTWGASGGNYSNSNVANYLPTYTGNLTAGNLLVGDNSNSSTYFIEKTDTNVTMGTAGGQQISVTDTTGISIGGTGGVQIQGVAGANVILGGSTSGNIILEQSLVFPDNTVQSTAYTGVSNPFNQDLNTTDNVTFANITSTDAIRFSNSGNIVGAMGYAPNYVSIEGYGSNSVNITANDVYTWTFDSVGNLNLPTNGNINFNGGGIVQTPMEDFDILVQDSDDDGWQLTQTIDAGDGNTWARTRLQRDQYSVNIQGKSWSFNDNGVLNLAGNVQGEYGVDSDIYVTNNGSNGSLNFKTISYIGDTLISNIQIANPNVTISTSNAAHTWNFDSVGNLTVPGNIISTVSTGLTLGSNYDVYIVADRTDNNRTWKFDGTAGELILPNNGVIDPTDNNFEVRGIQNVNFEANAVVNIYTDTSNNGWQWQFGDDGILTIPGNLVASGASPAPYLSGFSSATFIDSLRGDQVILSNNAISTVDGSSNLILNCQYGSATDSFIQVPTFQDGGEELIIKNGYGSSLGVRIQTGAGNFRFNGTDLSFTDSTTQNTAWTGTVALANVSGAGNIASVNLDGNLSNVLYGNGSFAAAPSSSYGDSNVVTLLSSFGSNTITTTGDVSVGAMTASGKIGYASGSTVTQTTNRGQGVNITALAGTIVTVSDTIAAGDADYFFVTNPLVDSTTDIVLVQVTSYNPGTYVVIAQPTSTPSNGFLLSITNITGFSSPTEAITIRFMVIRSPNA